MEWCRSNLARTSSSFSLVYVSSELLSRKSPNPEERNVHRLFRMTSSHASSSTRFSDRDGNRRAISARSSKFVLAVLRSGCMLGGFVPRLKACN